MTIFAVSAPDCDCYYFARADTSLFCDACDSYIGLAPYYPPDLIVNGRHGDFSGTYDNRLLLSLRATTFFSKARARGIEFRPVNEAQNLFVPVVHPVVEFDSESRRTRLLNRCAKCGNYESVIGATPPFLRNSRKLEERTVYRTDLEFGSGRGKSPLIIVGGDLAEEMRGAFAELVFSEGTALQ